MNLTSASHIDSEHSDSQKKKMNHRLLLTTVAVVGVFVVSAAHLDAQTDGGENIILGRPTDASIVVHVLAEEGTEISVEYGETPGRLLQSTASTVASADGTAVAMITKLAPDHHYYYRVAYMDIKGKRVGDEYSFRTQRSQGTTFNFGVQGDSHPERLGRMYHPDLYARTMRLVEDTQPDLYFMLGDDSNLSPLVADFFQGDRSMLTQKFVDNNYINQRRFLGLMAHSTALFPVNGNHELGYRSLLGTPLHDIAVFAGRARNRYLPVPTPDNFYSGNPEPVPGIGLLGDYFAFEWGDALFISLDPYWHSTRVTERVSGGMGMGMGSNPPWSEIVDEYNALTQSTGNLWDATIGDAQYEWFKTTLEESDAKYKFVFTHHVLGTGRGGIERATKYEWGGYTDDGEWEFGTQRPNWELPIHQLMVKNDVNIFFQAHDHIFAHQQLDGVVYQSVPNPADDTYTARNRNAYLSGGILDNSGYLNITVSPENVQVDYIRSYLPEHEVGSRRHGDVDYSYTVE